MEIPSSTPAREENTHKPVDDIAFYLTYRLSVKYQVVSHGTIQCIVILVNGFQNIQRN